VALATPATETSLGLLTVNPHVAEPLGLVALCEAALGFVCFDLYNDVRKVGEGEHSL
jgi:hypothetical protein